MRKIFLAVALLCAGVSRLAAQGSTTVGGLQMNQGNTLPATCNPGAAEPQAKLFLLTPANTIYTCSATNTWTAATGGAGVSTFSAGNLSPIFISSVANPTTTPALSFSLSSAAGNTIFGNCSGGSGAPSYCALTAAMLPIIALGNTPLTTRGDLLTANATPALARLPLGATGQCLTSNGSDAVWGSCTATGASTTADNTWTGPQRFKNGFPWHDVTAYGASGSNVTGTASISSGTTTITLGTAGDWKNGQGVYLLGCNGNYATTIVSGGGTTTLIAADAAPCTVSGQTIYHDDQIAFQNAFNDAVIDKGEVYCPPGNYNIMRAPLAVLGGQFLFQGSGQNSCKISYPSQGAASLGIGFTATTAATFYVSPLCAALLTGTGGSYCPGTGQVTWFDVRHDCNTCGQVNGLANITVEISFNLANLATAQTLISSGGIRDSLNSAEAFELTVNTNGSLTCKLNVAGTLRTITGASGAIVAGTTYHAALSYDGSNFRCFLAGTQVSGSPFAVTGTVTQQDYEMVDVGGLATGGDFPDGVPSQIIASTGRLDAFRISSSARYTANFTPPTAKFAASASDSNTLIQVSWDNNPTVFEVGTTGPFQLPVYLVQHKQCPASGNFLMKDLILGTSAYFATGGSDARVENVTFGGGSSGGLTVANCSYANRFTNVDFGGNRWGFASMSGLSRLTGLKNLSGNQVYPFILAPPGGNLDGLFLNVTQGQKIGVLLKPAGAAGSNVTITNFFDDAESTVTGYIANIVVDQIDSFIMDGGTSDVTVMACTTNCWNVVVQETNHQTAAQFNATIFSQASGQDAVIHHVLNSNNLNPIVLNQTMRSQSGVRWTDQPGHAAINAPTACANSHFALSAGWGSTATVTAATGFVQTCKITITSSGTGQALNPTVTDTFPAASFALPSTTQVCTADMAGGTGAITLMNQTSLSATAPIYTFQGTPASALTYIFVFRCGP